MSIRAAFLLAFIFAITLQTTFWLLYYRYGGCQLGAPPLPSLVLALLRLSLFPMNHLPYLGNTYLHITGASLVHEIFWTAAFFALWRIPTGLLSSLMACLRSCGFGPTSPVNPG